MIRWGFVAALVFAGAAQSEDLAVAFPVDCQLGKTCFIQNYVDRDPGPGRRDVGCGHLTYDGHTGTDIALLSDLDIQDAVAVTAVAPGTVRATRDGMADVNIRAENAPDVSGRGCGNAVVVDHADGWSSQYCHLRRGSVAVRTGDQVSPETVLGEVGLSGRTEFAHLELILRRGDQTVDPFNPNAGVACGLADVDLWSGDVPYSPAGLISAGFSPAIPSYADVKAGTAGHAALQPDAEALVAWAQVYGSLPGDVLQFEITRPDGRVFLETEVTLDAQRVRAFRAVGRKLKAAAWRVGAYTADIRYLRDGALLGAATAAVSIVD